jgi:hypothetical protein
MVVGTAVSTVVTTDAVVCSAVVTAPWAVAAT